MRARNCLITSCWTRSQGEAKRSARGSQEARHRVRRGRRDDDSREERPLLSAGGAGASQADEDTDNIYTTTAAAANDNNNKKRGGARHADDADDHVQVHQALKDKKNGLHVWNKEVDGAVRLAMFRRWMQS